MKVTPVNSSYYLTCDNAVLDLNNKTISNLNMTLIQAINDLEVLNGNINYLNNGTLMRDKSKFDVTYSFKNLILNGNINVDSVHYGPLASYIGNTSNEKQKAVVYAENITSYLNIDGTSEIGGLFGYCRNTYMNIKNSKVNSTITTVNNCGGFLLGSKPLSAGYETKDGKGLGEITNVKFNGVINVPKNKAAFCFGPNGDYNEISKGTTAVINNTISNENSLVSIPENMGEEIKINNFNKSITKYVIKYSFNVNYIDKPAGGYPRIITKEIKADSASDLISTGIFKYTIAAAKKEGNALVDGSDHIFTIGNDKTYYFDGEGTFVIDSSKKVTVSIYGYSGDRLVVTGSQTYIAK